MRRRRADENGGQELAELAALADGSLPQEQREALEARIAASQELASQLDEQRRAVALLQSAAAGVEAPASLRATVDGMERVRARHTHSTRRLVLAGAAAAAVIVVAAGITLRGSVSSSERFHAALAATALAPERKATNAHEDNLRLADPARRVRPAAPRRRTFLRGLAQEPGRCPRPDRHLQRGS